MCVCVFFVCILRVLPKSARWLMANKKHDEALDLIRKAALINGKPLVDNDFELCEVWLTLSLPSQIFDYTDMTILRSP